MGLLDGVLTGYFTIGLIITIGYVVERFGLLKQNIQAPVNLLIFYVLTPILLFTIIAKADIGSLFSDQLAVAAMSAALSFIIYFVIAIFILKKKLPDSLFGASAASYVNSNNMGIPIALYVVGTAEIAAPVMLLQIAILSPLLLTALDLSTVGKVSIRDVLLQPIRSPLILGTALGVLVSALQLKLPNFIYAPLDMLGAATVPMILLTFGMSLHGRRVLAPGSPKLEIAIASFIKLTIMPLIAYLIGAYLLGMSGIDLYAVTVMAALPTAQNVYNFAMKFNRSVIMVRDSALITTVLSFVVLLVVAAILKPAGI